MRFFESLSAEFVAGHREGRPGQPPRWHGHNYELRATFTGQLTDPGLIAPVRLLEQCLLAATDPLDGSDLSGLLRERADPLLTLAEHAVRGLRRYLSKDVTHCSTILRHGEAGVALEGRRHWRVFPGEFSAAHRTYAPLLSEAENDAIYGICANPAGHGHNYRAAIWHRDADGVPASLWAEFDHRNLSADIPDLQGRNVVTEAIAAALARRAPGARRVRVWETPDFFADHWPGSGAYVLGRRYTLSAAHQCAPDNWDETNGRLLFAACGRPGIHGHDFGIIVTVSGALDPRTEAAYDLGRLDHAVEAVLAPLRHTLLNDSVPGLAPRPATTLAIAQHLLAALTPELGPALRAAGVSAAPRHWSWATRGQDG